MKKIFYFLAASLLLVAGCNDNDDLKGRVDNLEDRVKALEDKVNAMNGDINSLKTIVDALDNGAVITDIAETDEGYVITFSNGKKMTIKHGDKGSDAPVIGIKKDTDNVYYWTITVGGQTDWLKDGDGNKMRVTGRDGEPGYPGTPGDKGDSPVIGVDSEGYWTVKYGNGTPTRILDAQGNPIKAEGKDGDSFFAGVDTSSPDYVVLTLNDEDETKIIIPIGKPLKFDIEKESVILKFGATTSLTVTHEGVKYLSIAKPDGWKAAYTEGTLTITAPAAGNVYAETTGKISVTVVGETHSIISSVDVTASGAVLDGSGAGGSDWEDWQ